MKELDIREFKISDLSRIADIHKTSLPDDFLPSLGIEFLKKIFYPAVSVSQNAKIFVVCQDDLAVGFAIISLNSSKLLKEIVFYNTFEFVRLIVSFVLFSFTQLRIALGILWSSFYSGVENDYGEIYIIAVDQAFRGCGIGKMLVKKSNEYIKTTRHPGIKIKTLKANKSWISFFEKNKWKRTSELRIAGKDYVILSQRF